MGGELALLADESDKQHKRGGKNKNVSFNGSSVKKPGKGKVITPNAHRKGAKWSSRGGGIGGSRGRQQRSTVSRSHCSVFVKSLPAPTREPRYELFREYGWPTLQHAVVYSYTWLRVGRAECK